MTEHILHYIKYWLRHMGIILKKTLHLNLDFFVKEKKTLYTNQRPLRTYFPKEFKMY